MKRLVLMIAAAAPAIGFADPVLFSTGAVTGNVATATRPASPGKFEIEAADDFVLDLPAKLTSATFTGLLTGGAVTSGISRVLIEIYRIFPDDSDVARTSGAPLFSTGLVPTRVNSPSDIALDIRDSSANQLTYTASLLGAAFTALNSVLPGDIHPSPNQTTGGGGPVTGTEVNITATFSTPLLLPAGHYFFVPQVAVNAPGGEFLWLSGTRPITAPGIPITPDLQSWTRDESLDPDWLRVGTDIVGGTSFNGAFSLSGAEIPEPSTFALVAFGTIVVGSRSRRRRMLPSSRPGAHHLPDSRFRRS